MASEWARKKAHALCSDEHCDDGYYDGANTDCVACRAVASALDEARAEGAAEGNRRRAEQDDVLAGVIAKTRAAALAEGEKRGAERERRGCWEEAAESETANEAAARISQRGPMRGPEEEILARAEKAEAQPQEAELRYAREFATRVDFQERAEKAEQERDDWRAAATTHIETIGILSDQKIQLQADLDAALDLVLANEKGISLIASEITDVDIELLKPWRDLMLRCRDEWRSSPNYRRIEALLAARKEEKRG